MAYTIGIDLTFIKDLKKAVGNEIAALSIVEGLYNNMHGHNFIIFANEDNAEDLRNRYPLFNVIATTTGRSFYYKFLPWFIKKTEINVMYYPKVEPFINLKLKTKIVITSHGLIRGQDFFVLDKLRSRMLKNVNTVIAVSDFVKDELTKKKGVYPKKIVTIPNPLAQMNKSVDVVFKKRHIVAVGSDKPQKNIMLVVRAFEKLVPIIDHDLVLIGDISEKGEIYKYIVENNLAHRIILTGRVSRDILFGYYKNAELFVNTSTYEGFGLAPLEAMVFNAPVVSTPIPSISELENVRFDSDLNYEDNETEVANKMLAVLNSDKDIEYLENRAERILDYYSLESISRKYIQVFENV
ncbi:MAG TPA: glycosyltransferase [Clostridia bacterium]|nr:MAG: N-acetylgalactosamine-N,N'-diacetylbacillosaminyl-diphospho-undecaprenol 4-alpha-N-acetylgalactosaminyltransferase [Firmicutes bacterium ADurb.Bin146]HOD93180.1 glycosyltransferase [Clostridia bacterium]HQM38909.1 glycosyltransferase [Clostridia bacterium]